MAYVAAGVLAGRQTPENHALAALFLTQLDLTTDCCAAALPIWGPFWRGKKDVGRRLLPRFGPERDCTEEQIPSTHLWTVFLLAIPVPRLNFIKTGNLGALSHHKRPLVADHPPPLVPHATDFGLCACQRAQQALCPRAFAFHTGQRMPGESAPMAKSGKKGVSITPAAQPQPETTKRG